ncbi:hypothetical protein [Aestuariibaculum marinum]|uniref:Uncharacterized protein n=1 Tax=Aestuariibaculum marinum TaxID=2683592 RepID=A0A8J6PYU9_9FLAO|nr:hypothetical protein [Aestuariibaculum marinum]MBD0822722.1 hypothetical protein [Aestuariibaculum marinum]
MTNENVLICSDVNARDGIGIEIYQNDELIMEIFRDDSTKSRTIRLFKEHISLELMEKYIRYFKREIPWDFEDHDCVK